MSTTIKYQPITASIFEKNVLTQGQSAVLVFGATWSGNSEMMDSMIERVCSEYVDQDISFYKVDVETQVSIAQYFGISTVPTLVFLKDSEIQDRCDGFLPAKKFRTKVERIYL